MCRKDVENFLDKEGQMRLTIFAENGRDYCAALLPPARYKKKAMYFVKNAAVKLSNENIDATVSYGDVSEAPLESLSAIVSNVFLPLLTSASNQTGWPDVLSKEISDSMHKFTANVFVSIGQTKGETLLPLPAGALWPSFFLRGLRLRQRM